MTVETTLPRTWQLSADLGASYPRPGNVPEEANGSLTLVLDAAGRPMNSTRPVNVS